MLIVERNAYRDGHFQEIGEVSATAPWRGAAEEGIARAAALRRLVGKAEDFDADALVDVAYRVEALGDGEHADAPMRRVVATGVAARRRALRGAA
ncbi:MAG: hypothetical protein KGQ28_04795 [Hyphomicrobiales bacterium]|nr:hypothetical protein [Hyphomicrobiales bacterium]